MVSSPSTSSAKRALPQRRRSRGDASVRSRLPAKLAASGLWSRPGTLALRQWQYFGAWLSDSVRGITAVDYRFGHPPLWKVRWNFTGRALLAREPLSSGKLDDRRNCFDNLRITLKDPSQTDPLISLLSRVCNSHHITFLEHSHSWDIQDIGDIEEPWCKATHLDLLHRIQFSANSRRAGHHASAAASGYFHWKIVSKDDRLKQSSTDFEKQLFTYFQKCEKWGSELPHLGSLIAKMRWMSDLTACVRAQMRLRNKKKSPSSRLWGWRGTTLDLGKRKIRATDGIGRFHRY